MGIKVLGRDAAVLMCRTLSPLGQTNAIIALLHISLYTKRTDVPLRCLGSVVSVMSPNPSKGYDRCFCIRMKSTLTKRGVHFKSSGYRVRLNSVYATTVVSYSQTCGIFAYFIRLCRVQGWPKKPHCFSDLITL